MSTLLYQWGADWRIPFEALRDLQRRMGVYPDESDTSARSGSEAAVQAALRVEASKVGARLWRNNVGVLTDSRGIPVRYGLANDSAETNRVMKSGDLIGIKPVTVAQHMVGWTLGVFLSREVKRPGWRYSGSEREQGQLRWAEHVLALGGDACFVTGPGTL